MMLVTIAIVSFNRVEKILPVYWVNYFKIQIFQFFVDLPSEAFINFFLLGFKIISFFYLVHNINPVDMVIKSR